jgi:hypothetical protein
LRHRNADQARRRNCRESGARATGESTTAKMPGSDPILHSPLAARLRLSNIFAGFYDILTPAITSEETERNHG